MVLVILKFHERETLIENSHFSRNMNFELAESLIICSLSLTAKCIGLTCSDRRELKQKSESEEGWDVTLHRVKCYV